MKVLRHIEFFSGIGGMRIAVEQASQVPVACRAYDISIEGNRVYDFNFPTRGSFGRKVCTKLVEQIKVADIPASDLWTMSPPCQPFTKTLHAQQRDLDDKRCKGFVSLLQLLVDLPVEKRPKYFFVENVAPFVGSRAHKLLHARLVEAGYCWKEYVLSPVDIGIPNQRTRYYLMAETHSERFDNSMMSKWTVSSGMKSLASFVDSEMNQSSSQWSNFAISDEVLKESWAKDLPIADARKLDTITYCFTSGYSRQLHKATGSLLLVPEKDQDSSSTVSEDFALRYSNQVRRFTPKELLKLFGFPSSFSFPEQTTIEHQYRLIGNSISVFVVAKLMGELLNGQECESI